MQGAVCFIQLAVCSVKWAVCSLQCAVCIVQCTVCSLHFGGAVCSFKFFCLESKERSQCATCSMNLRYAVSLCSMKCTCAGAGLGVGADAGTVYSVQCAVCSVQCAA